VEVPALGFSGARSAAGNNRPWSIQEALLKQLARAADRRERGALPRTLGLDLARGAGHTPLDNQGGWVPKRGRTQPHEQVLIAMQQHRLGPLEALLERYGARLEAGMPSDPSGRSLFAELLGILAGPGGGILSAPLALATAGAIRVLGQEASAFSDPSISDGRTAAAEGRIREQHGVLVADARLGAYTVSRHVFGISWTDPGRPRGLSRTDPFGTVLAGADDKEEQDHHIGFRIGAGVAGDGSPAMPILMAVESAYQVLERGERGRQRTKEILKERPLVAWLAERGADTGGMQPAVLTQATLDWLTEHGHTIHYQPFVLADLQPRAMRSKGSDRHIAGDLFVRGILAESGPLLALRTAICRRIALLLEADRGLVLQYLEANGGWGQTIPPDGRKVAQAEILRDHLQDLEIRAQVSLDLAQVDLLLAVGAYGKIGADGGGVGPDPFAALLPRQIVAELASRGWKRRDREHLKFAQGLDWLLNHAQAHHEPRVEGLTGLGRRIASLRAAMDEAQALCRGGEPAAAILRRYAGRTGKVALLPGVWGALECLAEGNQHSLESQYWSNLDPVLRAGQVVDRSLKRVLIDALTRMVLSAPERFQVAKDLHAAHVRDRVGVALDGAVRDRYAIRESREPDRPLRVPAAEAKPPEIQQLDAALASLLQRDAQLGFCHPDLKAVLDGAEPGAVPGAGQAFHTALGCAQAAFRLVAEVANWEGAWHRRTEDVARHARVLATLARGGAEDPMAPPHAVTLNFPVAPTAVNFLISHRSRATGRRFVNLQAVFDPADGFYQLQPSPDLSLEQLGTLFFRQNGLDERTTYIPHPLELQDMNVGGPRWHLRDAFLDMRVPLLDPERERFLYLLTCDGRSPAAARLALRLEGTFLARVDPAGVGAAFLYGRGDPVPRTYLHTSGPGPDRFRPFTLDAAGARALAEHLDLALADSALPAAERPRVRAVQDRVIAHFEGLVQALAEGATGVASLLPSGQTAGRSLRPEGEGLIGFGQKPDLLSLVVYDSSRDRWATAVATMAGRRAEPSRWAGAGLDDRNSIRLGQEVYYASPKLKAAALAYHDQRKSEGASWVLDAAANADGVRALLGLIDLRMQQFGCSMAPMVIEALARA
jgi:hypothetical protein